MQECHLDSCRVNKLLRIFKLQMMSPSICFLIWVSMCIVFTSFIIFHVEASFHSQKASLSTHVELTSHVIPLLCLTSTRQFRCHRCSLRNTTTSKTFTKKADTRYDTTISAVCLLRSIASSIPPWKKWAPAHYTAMGSTNFLRHALQTAKSLGMALRDA